MEWVGIRTGFGGGLVFVGDVRIGTASLAGSGVGSDGGCGSAVCELVERGGGAGCGDGGSGSGSGQCV